MAEEKRKTAGGRQKVRYVCAAALLALMLLTTGALRRQEAAQVRVLEVPPPELTAGETASFAVSAPEGAEVTAHTSDPAAVTLEVLSVADGRAVCRVSAAGDGNALLSCKVNGRASPAYAVSVVAPEEQDDGSTQQTTGVANKKGGRDNLSTCGAAGRIREKNRVTFPDAQAAAAQGYTPCALCLPESG